MACYFIELHPVIDLSCYQLLLYLLNLNFKYFNLYTSYLSITLPPSTLDSAILRPHPSPLVLAPFFCSLCAQSCPTLGDTIDYNPQAPLSMEFPRQETWSGFPVSSPGDLPHPGIEPTSLCCFSHVQLVTPRTVARQALVSMGFSRQEYWNGLPFSSPGDLPHPGIKLRSLALQADSLRATGKPWQVSISSCDCQVNICFSS